MSQHVEEQVKELSLVEKRALPAELLRRGRFLMQIDSLLSEALGKVNTNQ